MDQVQLAPVQQVDGEAPAVPDQLVAQVPLVDVHRQPGDLGEIEARTALSEIMPLVRPCQLEVIATIGEANWRNSS